MHEFNKVNWAKRQLVNRTHFSSCRRDLLGWDLTAILLLLQVAQSSNLSFAAHRVTFGRVLGLQQRQLHRYGIQLSLSDSSGN